MRHDYEAPVQRGQDESALIKSSESKEWLQHHPEAGSSWPSWPKALSPSSECGTSDSREQILENWLINYLNPKMAQLPKWLANFGRFASVSVRAGYGHDSHHGGNSLMRLSIHTLF